VAVGNSRTTRGSFVPHTVKMASLGSSAILLVLITTAARSPAVNAAVSCVLTSSSGSTSGRSLAGAVALVAADEDDVEGDGMWTASDAALVDGVLSPVAGDDDDVDVDGMLTASEVSLLPSLSLLMPWADAEP